MTEPASLYVVTLCYIVPIGAALTNWTYTSVLPANDEQHAIDTGSDAVLSEMKERFGPDVDLAPYARFVHEIPREVICSAGYTAPSDDPMHPSNRRIVLPS